MVQAWPRSSLLQTLLYIGSLAVTFSATPAQAEDTGSRLLPTIHRQAVVTSGAAPKLASLSPTQRVALSIVLPSRDPAGLGALLHDIYDPSSLRYRHFLSRAEFTERFGPPEADYATLSQFLVENNFSVTGTSANRQVLQVAANVADIDRVFHVSMGLLYRAPGQPRTFFAADREPSIELAVPLWHIGGLDDYSIPRSNLVEGRTAPAVTGSGPDGSYFASDIRAAYYGNGPLTGAGQSLALVEFGAYWPGDLKNYFSTPGIAADSVPINLTLLDGQVLCTAACSDGEPILDIAQAIGMAPGLSGLNVYLGTYWIDILNQIASDDSANQISISYTWAEPDPTAADPIFEEYAAQGQSVFVASGDCGAFLAETDEQCPAGIGEETATYPQEDQYITAVGGTALTTAKPGGAWASEIGWSRGGGGNADGIALPSWQDSIINSADDASPTLRNVPDVAADATTDSYNCSNGACVTDTGGTSAAAPLLGRIYGARQ